MSQDPPDTMKGKVEQNIQNIRSGSANELNDALANPRGELKMSHRHKAMAHLAAIGFTPREIAMQLGISTRRVSPLFQSDSFQREVAVIQEQIFLKDPQKIFMKILPKAIQRAYDVMMNAKKDTTVADTAFKFMDRALGKPEQKIEHGSNNLRELIDKLDAIEKEQREPKTIEVGGHEIQDAEIVKEVITDEVEKFVQENYGDSQKKKRKPVVGSPV